MKKTMMTTGGVCSIKIKLNIKTQLIYLNMKMMKKKDKKQQKISSNKFLKEISEKMLINLKKTILRK